MLGGALGEANRELALHFRTEEGIRDLVPPSSSERGSRSKNHLLSHSAPFVATLMIVKPACSVRSCTVETAVR
jgi:hypothetical protein